jgi:hypothetical protein
MKYRGSDLIAAISYLEKKCGGTDPEVYIEPRTRDLCFETYNNYNEKVVIMITPKDRNTPTKIQVTRNLGEEA